MKQNALFLCFLNANTFFLYMSQSEMVPWSPGLPCGLLGLCKLGVRGGLGDPKLMPKIRRFYGGYGDLGGLVQTGGPWGVGGPQN